MTSRQALWAVAMLFMVAPSMVHAQNRQAQGVNGYMPDEERRARDAARAAGFVPTTLGFVQAGNFFLNATRGGQTYSLTVTPDGKIYPSMPAG